VGQGDAIFIHFPDGKNMMIDSGDGEKKSVDYIKGFMSEFGVDKIDYLMLTHPMQDHQGGMEMLLNNYTVSNFYIPYIIDADNFPIFKGISELASEKQVNKIESQSYKNIKGEDYALAILTPYPFNYPNVESAYKPINNIFPTENAINNVSPMVYVKYKSVRFLFTGDAGVAQEHKVIDNYNAFVQMFSSLGIELNLENIDFLKVSRHGSANSSSEKFLSTLKPKNAVISVGGANNYGLPSTEMLARLATASPAHNLYRTDVHGTISVYVSNDGEIRIQTDYKEN
jgi:competence protein ComEC